MLAGRRNCLQDAVQFVLNLPVRKADHLNSLGFEPGAPVQIVVNLTGMAATVDLDDQMSLWTIEIGDVRSKRRLPGAFEAAQISVTQPFPGTLFCGG